MIIPIRCYAVMAGTHAADPLGVELLRARTRDAADRIAASIQAHVRSGVLLGGAQYFVRDVDEELDLGVPDKAAAQALGYDVRLQDGDTPFVAGSGGVQIDHLEIARRRDARAVEETPEPEMEPAPPTKGRAAIVSGDEVLAP